MELPLPVIAVGEVQAVTWRFEYISLRTARWCLIGVSIVSLAMIFHSMYVVTELIAPSIDRALELELHTRCVIAKSPSELNPGSNDLHGPFLQFNVSYGAFNQYLTTAEMLLVARALNATAVVPTLQTRQDWMSDFYDVKYHPLPFSRSFDAAHLKRYWSHRNLTIVDQLPAHANLTFVRVKLKEGLNFDVSAHVLNHTTNTGEFDLKTIVFDIRVPPFFVWSFSKTPELRDLCSMALNGLRPSPGVRMLARELYRNITEYAAALIASNPAPPIIVGVHFRIEKDSRIFGLPSPVDMFMDQFEVLLNTTLPKQGIDPSRAVFYLATGEVPDDSREEILTKLNATIPHRYFFKETQWVQNMYFVEAVAFTDAIVLANVPYFVGHPVSSLSVAVHNWRTSSSRPSVLLPVPLRNGIDAASKFNCTSPGLRPFYDLGPEEYC
eukprot:TRINITY_DN10183_c0_g1_i1.p1 TRINITY_DN10183_c0_g1~~TRINITY_DN10183_c0_g1_i1.p1  ORF type:complete len:439 (+),score=40.98 TRINITY_DN10183_c0_g1_i1:151-1467(+)